MPQYTTGELAKACNVTVRTVQFYDTKGLLKPSALTEGGRRIYDEEDLNKLRSICLLKSLGLTLDAIKGILESESPSNVLLLLLGEQEKVVEHEIKDRQKQLQTIRVVKESIQGTESIPVGAISDIEQMMHSRKQQRNTNRMLLAAGIAVVFLLWLFQGYPLTWEIAVPMLIFWAIPRITKYLKNTAYTCPACGMAFRPAIRKMLFSRQTPKTIKGKCPRCEKVNYCVQVHTLD